MRRELTDLVKVIAAVAVVGIHSTSQSEAAFARDHHFFSLDFISIFVNQWARFSVPLFIYLSAYGLTLSDKSSWQSFAADYWGFIRKRLPTILIPYLFFSALAFALDFRNLTFDHVAEKLLHGGADYHLYFLVILAQCYLLFPLLLRMQLRSPKFFRIFVWLAFVLVVLLLYRTTSERVLGFFGLSHPGWHASFCIYWLPYFMLGILHAKQSLLNKEKEKSRALEAFRRNAITPLTILIVLLTLSCVTAEYIYSSYNGIPVDYYNHFSRPFVAFYALAVIYMLNSNRGDSGGSFQKIAALAPLTFTVYLVHPQILRLVNLIQMPTLFAWLVTTAAAFAAAYLWGIVKGRSPLTSILSRKSA